MSDVLKGVLPEDVAPTDELGMMAQNYIMIVLGRTLNESDENPLIGTLEGVMYSGNDVEIEVRVELDEALLFVRGAPSVIKDNKLKTSISFIELHVGEKVTRFEPRAGFSIGGVRVATIDYRRRMCTLLLNLRHSA